jgi:molecular chaperone DnaJ
MVLRKREAGSASSADKLEEGGEEGSAGDLLVAVQVAPDARLQRRGRDLHSSLRVAFYDAILGGAASVAAVGGGEARVQIPAGAQSGQQVRLRGKGGFDFLGSARGDHVVTLNVTLPAYRSGPRRELLQKLGAIEKAGHQGG